MFLCLNRWMEPCREAETSPKKQEPIWSLIWLYRLSSVTSRKSTRFWAFTSLAKKQSVTSLRLLLSSARYHSVSSMTMFWNSCQAAGAPAVAVFS